MPHHSQHAPQLLTRVHRDPVLHCCPVASLRVGTRACPRARGALQGFSQVGGRGRLCLESHRGGGEREAGLQAARRQRRDDHRPEYLRAIVVIFGAGLHEAPAVHVAYEAAALTPQEVEAAHVLAECKTDRAGDLLLGRAQQHRIPLLFTVRRALNATVEHGRLPGLRVGVVRPNSVNLDVCTPRLHEAFVHERAPPADVPAMVGQVLGGAVSFFPEKALHAPAHVVRVVDVDVMVFSIHGFLHKRLLQLHAVDHDALFALLEAFRVLILVLHPLSAHDVVVRARHSVVAENLVDLPAVHQDVLPRDVVQHERAPELDVLLGLLKREPCREEGDQAVHRRPFLHGGAQDGLVAEDHELEVVPGPKAVQHRRHRL